jgi:hypothetical protein
VAAVLCASYDRPIWAGAVLGAAIANKEWALLAVGPVLVALPHRRLLSLTCAATVAVAIMSPFVIGGKLSLSHGLQGLPAATTGVIFTPWQVWWFFGSPWQGPYGGRVAPGWIPGLAHPLIVGITIPLTLLYVHQLRRRRGGTPDGLLLLAFLLLLRCMLDPWDFSYYATPFLIALTAWETLRFKRIPVVAVIASFVAWILYVKIPQHFSLDRQALSFLLVSCAATAAMALSLYAPGVRQLLAGPRGQRSNVEPPLEAG